MSENVFILLKKLHGDNRDTYTDQGNKSLGNFLNMLIKYILGPEQKFGKVGYPDQTTFFRS